MDEEVIRQAIVEAISAALPSKQEILEAIHHGVYDAMPVDIADVIAKAVSDSFPRNAGSASAVAHGAKEALRHG